MKVYLIEHSFGDGYESSYTTIDKGFLNKSDADIHVRDENDKYKLLIKEHDDICDSHVQNCEEDDCTICDSYYDQQSYLYDNHSWKVIEVDIECKGEYLNEN